MSARIAATVASALAFLWAGAPDVRAETLVIEAALLLPVSGPPLDNAVVVVEGDRIRAVGRAGSLDVPVGARRLRARVVTPGFIDAQTGAGLAGAQNVPSVDDVDEATGPDQAELRAIDAFNPDEPLLRWLLEHGVTVVQSGPGPANPIAGQAGIFRTHGHSADEMAIRSPSALVLNLGEHPKLTYGGESKFPSTRMGTAALIRSALREGREAPRRRGWLRRREAPDPGIEVLGEVARGRLPAIISAHRADDILTAIRIADEFDLDWRLAGASEGYLVTDALVRAGVPVLVGPVMERPSLPETENASFENAAILERAGLTVAIRSGFEAYVPRSRIVLFEAAVAVANGLPAAQALRSITLTPAEILGIDDDYGSVEPGKVADLVLFDGDPLEYTTPIDAVIAAGAVVHRRDGAGGR